MTYIAPAHAQTLHSAGPPIKGFAYSDLLKTWVSRDLKVSVTVTDDGREWVFFKGETGLDDALVVVQYTPDVREALTAALVKALEWADVARKNKADTYKGITCVGSDEQRICARTGAPFEENQMALRFYSKIAAGQVNLVVDMISRDNQFTKTTIFFEMSEVRRFQKLLYGLREAFAKAHETARKQELFK
ncbi:MAG: hypothetical protein LAO51_01660 [Acidobacteriia bacterium]|nr:hypothetical protein [Terriglobia bacterium]